MDDPTRVVQSLFEEAVSDSTAQLRYLDALLSYLKKIRSPVEQFQKSLTSDLKVMKLNTETQSTFLSEVEKLHDSFSVIGRDMMGVTSHVDNMLGLLSSHLAEVTPAVKDLIADGQKSLGDCKQMEGQVEKKQKQQDKLQDEQKTLLSEQLQITEAKQQKLELKLYKLQEKLSQADLEIAEGKKELGKVMLSTYVDLLPKTLNAMQEIKRNNARLLSEGMKTICHSSNASVSDVSSHLRDSIAMLEKVSVESEINDFRRRLAGAISDPSKIFYDEDAGKRPTPPPKQKSVSSNNSNSYSEKPSAGAGPAQFELPRTQPRQQSRPPVQQTAQPQPIKPMSPSGNRGGAPKPPRPQTKGAPKGAPKGKKPPRPRPPAADDRDLMKPPRPRAKRQPSNGGGAPPVPQRKKAPIPALPTFGEK